MVFFNYALRKLNAKIVYYGPGLCGKTTNLQWIHDHFEGGKKGNMLSLATEGDRTIFFDLLPLDIGTIRGMDVTLQLYTVPGQVHYNSTRQLVLRGADGVVFVADSQRAMLGSNVDSWRNLKENLLLQGIELKSFPHVLQFNKRDLRDILPVETLDEELNEYSAPIFEAVATEGIGVQETLEGMVKLVMRSLRERYEAEFSHPQAPAGFGAPSVAPAAPAPPPQAPPNQPPAWPVPQPGPAAAPPAEGEREASTAPVDFESSPEAETHPGIAGLSLSSREEEEEKEPTLVIAPEDTGLPAPEVGDVELDEGALETADLVEERAPLEIELPEAKPPSLDIPPEDNDAGPPLPARGPEEAMTGEAEMEVGISGAVQEEAEPDSESAVRVHGNAFDEAPSPSPAVEFREEPSEPEEAQERPASRGGTEAPPPAAPEAAASTMTEAAEIMRADEGPGDEMEAPTDTSAGAGEPWAGEVPEAPGTPADEPAGGGEEMFGPGDSAGPAESAPLEIAEEEPGLGAGIPVTEERAPAAPEPGPGEPSAVEAPAAAAEASAAPAVDPFDLPPEEVTHAPIPDEDLFTGREEAVDEIPSTEASEERVQAAEEATEIPAAVHDRPTAVWEGDPFELPPEDLGVGAETRVPAPVEARAVTGEGGGNQLRLSLEGTGALAEYGQVRELDIVVPVPGDWIGGRKVTLQFRLTLVPEGEAE